MNFPRRFKRLVSFVTVVGALAASGCSLAPKDKELVSAVQDYCSVMQMVYIQQNLAPLAQVATEKELSKVNPVVMALESTDNVMKTEIEKFSVTVTRKDGDENSTVETKERWKFWWEDRKTGVITKEKKVENYHLRYHLKKEKGRWKVDFIDNLDDPGK